MADEPTPGQEPGGNEPASEPQQEPKPPWGSNEEFDPEKAWKLLQNVRADAEKAKADREALAQKVQQHEDATKSDTQKLEEKATSAEQRASKAEQEAARLRVALKKGLTETQAKRLVGESEEELENDAEELLASFKSDDDGSQGSQRRPRERLRPGAAPSSEPDGASDMNTRLRRAAGRA
jgi:hypothetical protein